MSKIENNLRFARIVCIVGAVFDGLTLFPMLFPSLGRKMFGIAGFSLGADYRYAMNLGASLMLGWTLLLFWAARRPVERAGVLLLTVVVVIGLALAGADAVSSGLIPLQNMLPVFVFQSCLVVIFITAYKKARNSSRSGSS